MNGKRAVGVLAAGALGIGVAAAAGGCGEDRGSVKIQGPATATTGAATSPTATVTAPTAPTAPTTAPTTSTAPRRTKTGN